MIFESVMKKHGIYDFFDFRIFHDAQFFSLAADSSCLAAKKLGIFPAKPNFMSFSAKMQSLVAHTWVKRINIRPGLLDDILGPPAFELRSLRPLLEVTDVTVPDHAKTDLGHTFQSLKGL
jgi:hypothetical protein